MSAPAVTIGARVRLRFGAECVREGVVEHIRADGYAMVRVSPGWVHAERIERCEVLA